MARSTYWDYRWNHIYAIVDDFGNIQIIRTLNDNRWLRCTWDFSANFVGSNGY